MLLKILEIGRSIVLSPSLLIEKNTSKYLHHTLPTGAQPFPKNRNGDRICNEWKFHYKGWKNDAMPYRDGATTSNLFPEDMNGELDFTLLKSLGLTTDRVVDCDAFFLSVDSTSVRSKNI